MNNRDIIKQSAENEFSSYKLQMLKQAPEQIFSSAYRIVCMERIMQSVITNLNCISEARVNELVNCKNLVALLTEEWLGLCDMEDLGAELDDFVKSTLTNMTFKTRYFS